jgi:hypothetical protein
VSRCGEAARFPVGCRLLFVIGTALGAAAPAGVASVPLQLPISDVLAVLAVRIWRTAGQR